MRRNAEQIKIKFAQAWEDWGEGEDGKAKQEICIVFRKLDDGSASLQ